MGNGNHERFDIKNIILRLLGHIVAGYCELQSSLDENEKIIRVRIISFRI